MPKHWSQQILDRPFKTILSINSELLKNKDGDFVYDPSIKINLVNKGHLKDFVQIDYSKIYILKYYSISTIGVVEIPILHKTIKFNVVESIPNSDIIGFVGKSLLQELHLPVPFDS